MAKDKDTQWLESAGFEEGENESGIKTWTKNIESDMRLTVMRHIGYHAWKCRAEWLPLEERICNECFWCVGYGDTPDMAVAAAIGRTMNIGYAIAESAECADHEVTTIRTLTDAERTILEHEFEDYSVITYPTAHIIELDTGGSMANPYIVGKQVGDDGIAWSSVIVPGFGTCLRDVHELALKRDKAWLKDIGAAVDELKESIASLSAITTRNQKTSPEAQPKKRRGTQRRS